MHERFGMREAFIPSCHKIFRYLLLSEIGKISVTNYFFVLPDASMPWQIPSTSLCSIPNRPGSWLREIFSLVRRIDAVIVSYRQEIFSAYNFSVRDDYLHSMIYREIFSMLEGLTLSGGFSPSLTLLSVYAFASLSVALHYRKNPRFSEMEASDVAVIDPSAGRPCERMVPREVSTSTVLFYSNKFSTARYPAGYGTYTSAEPNSQVSSEQTRGSIVRHAATMHQYYY